MDDDGQAKITKPVAWRRILLVFAVASLVIGAFLLAPVIRHEMETGKAEQIKRVHAEGLVPCSQNDRAAFSIDGVLLARLPAAPTLSITAYPSFHDIESVHLVGRDLYYARLQHPAVEFPQPPMSSRTPKVTKLSKARLSDPVSRELVKLVESDIAHAAAEWPMALDGVTYHFESPTGCALAWSPDGDTRARKMVDLFWSLAARGSNYGSPKDKVDDVALLKAIQALQASK